MTKLLNLVIVVLALALIGFIVYPQIQENRPRVVRFACDSTVASLPILVGIEDTLFEKNRIIPELVWYSDPDQAIADLFAGKADVGVFPWSTVLKRIATQTETLRVFLSQDYRQTLPVDAIIVPAKSKITKFTDLKKKRLGYPAHLRDYVGLLLANLNVPAREVTLQELPLSTIVDRLRAGAIDAAWLLEPALCTVDTLEFRALQAGALPRYVSSPFPGAAMGFSPAFYASGKVQLSRMKISTDAAVAKIETDAERVKLILAKYLPYCREMRGECRLPEMQRLVEINRPAIAALSDRLVSAGILPDRVETQSVFVEPARLTR